MPSVTSLEKQEYYGFQHNRFWRIMEDYFQVELNDYEAKKKCIQEHGIILWDVIASCERVGSLDSAIRNVVCNDIVGMIQTYPSISMIICNGKKSYSIYQTYFKTKIDVPCVCLPSTSNANRSISQEALFHIWKQQLQNANV